MRENVATPEGRALGVEIARLCDREAELRGRDGRCSTCAFRAGDHVANGSPETLMSALKCAMEREPFWCHEHDCPCAGWQLMRFDAGGTVAAPWDHPEGADDVPNDCPGCGGRAMFAGGHWLMCHQHPCVAYASAIAPIEARSDETEDTGSARKGESGNKLQTQSGDTNG